MLDTLDALLATAAVVLGLSLIVQAIQQIIKQWLDLKSNYMRVQLLAMFDTPAVNQMFNFQGLWNVNTIANRANNQAQTVVKQLENIMRTFGYRNLEILETMSVIKLKEIVGSIQWPDTSISVAEIQKDIDAWFDIAIKGFQDLYERRMKLWAFLISAVIVIVMNASIFEVYKEFSVNKPLRDAANAWLQKTVTQPRDSVIVIVKPNQKDSINIVKKSEEQNVKEIKESFAYVKSSISEQSFQLFRWTKPYREALFCASYPKWIINWIETLLGWLAMTLLVSLGAPFWYDLLKAIMGIKNTLNSKK
jgi:hypothetical protein